MREHERQRNDSQRRDQQRRASTAKPGASHGDSGADTTPRGDDVASSSGLVLPGGKVGEDALRRAIEQARELGVGEENEAALRTVRF